MKKRRVMAMLLAGTMALSSPLSVIASDIDLYAEPGNETVTESVEDSENVNIVQENGQSDVELAEEPDNNMDDNFAEDTTDVDNNDSIVNDSSESDADIFSDSSAPQNPSCIAVFSNGTIADVEVSDDDIALDEYKLDLREVTGDMKKETGSALANKESILMFDLAVKDSNDTEMLLSDDNIVKMTVDDMSFLNGSTLYHQKEDGTWEELEYKYSHNDTTNKYEIEFPGKTFGIFSFAKTAQEDLTINNDSSVSNDEQLTDNSTDNTNGSSDNEDLSVVENTNSFSWNGGIAGNNVDVTVQGVTEFPKSDILQVSEIPKDELQKKLDGIKKDSEKDIESVFPVEMKICGTDGIEDSMDEEYEISINGFNTPDNSILYHEQLNGNWKEVPYDSSGNDGTRFTSDNGLGSFIFVNEQKKQEIEENKTDNQSDTKANETKNDESDITVSNEKIYTFEDEDVVITATINKDAEIPETAELRAEKLEEGSDAYNSAVEEVEKSINLSDNQKLLFIPYDVYFLNEGEKIEPTDGKVQVKMSFKDSLFGVSPKNNETFAAHIKNDGVVEKVTNTAEEKDTLSFAVSSFSIMGPAMVTSVDNDIATRTVEPIIIDDFNASFSSGATLTNGKYVWNPTDPVDDHMFIYRIDYTMSGVFSTDKGAFKLEVPLHILKDRDGNWADTFDCPYRMESELTSADSPDFVYTIDEENNKAIIYNYNPYPAGEAGYIEVSYSTSKNTMYYVDMGGSTSFNAKVYATNSNSTVTKEATAVPVYIDTHATISYTEKKQPTLYKTWQNDWGEKPTDADNYLYLLWPIRTYVNKNTSPYNFYLDDTFSSLGGNVVGYRFAGQSTFSNVNHVDNITSYGDRYDFVITRHGKDEAENEINSTSALRYEVHNEVIAKVDPVDQIDDDTTAMSSRDWWYEKPRYYVPTGHFWSDKWGVYGNENRARSYGAYFGNDRVKDSEDISDYTLAEFCDGDEQTIDRLEYYTYANAYPYPWTLGDGATGKVDDALNGLYGKKKVDYQFTDDTFYLENIKLNDSDYDLTTVRWKPIVNDATFDSTTYTFTETPISSYKNSDKISIFARKDNNWKQVATYNLQNKTYENVDSTYIKEAAAEKVSFLTGVKGIRFTASNGYYHTLIGMYPEISLNRTDNVLKLVGTNKKVRVKNESTFIVTQNNNRLFSRTITGTDYVQKVIRESEIKKDVIQTKNMKKESHFDVTWRIGMAEKYIDNDGLHYIRQESGKFYDLLPAGAILNTSSIAVTASDAELGIGEYSYEIENNFRNSGRAMLIVTINESTKNKYILKYQTSHTYDSINDYGKNLLNSVAYESGNDKIGEGLPDNGGNITDKTIFTDLDPDTNANKFKYAEARYNINLPLAAATGLKKQIKNSTATQYSYETTVRLNEDYSYQVRLTNDASTESKDIIFFDSLENFFQKAEETSPTKVSDWKGKLTGINVNNLVFKGISPVIYLSKVDTMNIQNHHDFSEKINDESVWVPYNTFVSKYGLDKATAIAVDASRMVTGNDFVMQKKESISFDIYMKAPEEDKSGKTDPIAYNNIYVSRTALRTDGDGTDEIPQFYHQDYTKAHYRVAGDLEIKKVDTTDMTTAIKGITYKLSGTSDYGTDYMEERVSDKNGNMQFESIEKGNYELREISCSDDWQLNMETYTVTINEKGIAVINGLTKSGNAYIVSDKPRIHADVFFLKYNNVTGGMVKGAKFRLSGTSDYGNDYLMYAESNEIGRVDFENIELGTYELTETEAPSGYIKKSDAWTVKVDERGVASIYDGDAEESKNTSGYYTLINEPYHSIRFVKSSTYGDNIYLEGAEFSLTGVSDYGTSVEKTAVSGKAEDGGLVVFDGLEPGTYILKETKAPAEHDLNEKPYTVKVNKNGTFTIEGLEKVQFGTKSVAYSLLDNVENVDSKQDTLNIIDDVEENLTEEFQQKDTNKKTISLLDKMEQNADTES